MNKNSKTWTPGRLAVRLAVWYLGLGVIVFFTFNVSPEVSQYLPVGGHDALEYSLSRDSSENSISLPGIDFSEESGFEDRVASARVISILVLVHIVGTLLLMIPIAWTYRAINYDVGFPRNFVRSLILIPICATTIVLLIQNNLALAFGLAALVAAVRFRVSLDEAMDGIFVFASIAVGLSSGVGYLGIAIVMSMFFCLASLVMWALEFGRNPIDDTRTQRKIEKLQAPVSPKADTGDRPVENTSR